MLKLADLLTKHETLKTVEGINNFDGIAKALQDAGYSLIIDNPKEANYIPKARFEELVGQKNELKTQLETAENKIKELGKLTKDNEDLQGKIADYENQKKDWEKRQSDLKLETEIKFGAMKSNAKDPADILAFIDKSKLSLGADGSVIGLKEQLETLKTSKGYLFEEVKVGGNGNNPAGGSGNNPNSKNPWSKEHFNLTEQGKILMSNPVLAQQLIASANNN